MRVFDLPVIRTSSWIFNCYLLGDPDTNVVAVDPGLPIVTARALAALGDELGRPPTDLTSIICTHGHPDHVGGVADLQHRTGADVLLPARCEKYLAGERPRTFAVLDAAARFMPVWGDQPFESKAMRQLAGRNRKVGYGGPPTMSVDFDIAGYITDGDELPTAPGWTVFHTPGHTDDSTSLYHADSATLISGDAVVTVDGAAWFNPEYVDLDTSKETEERLRSLEVRHLLPGHGHPIEAPNVWATARSSTDKPTGSSLLARCSRRFGRWP